MRLDILVPIALVMGLFVGGMVATRVWVTAVPKTLRGRTTATAWAGFTGALAGATATLCVGFIALVLTVLVINLGGAVGSLFS